MTTTRYSYVLTDTLHNKLDPGSLDNGIRKSGIVTALVGVQLIGSDIHIDFKDPLSAGDQTALTSLVNNHEGQPLGAALEVKVLEEDANQRTQGHYQGRGLKMSIPASTGTYNEDFTFNFPICLMSMEYVPTLAMEGDEFCALVAPETIIGAITADVTASDTVINVSPTVLENIQIGYVVHLDDLTNKDPLGEVLAIDKAAGTITVETGAVNGFAAATPTYVKQTIVMAKDVRINGVARVELGSTKIGGSYLPTGTVIRIEYHNHSGTAKTFSAIAEYLY